MLFYFVRCPFILQMLQNDSSIFLTRGLCQNKHVVAAVKKDILLESLKLELNLLVAVDVA